METAEIDEKQEEDRSGESWPAFEPGAVLRPLAENEIHVWRAPLDAMGDRLARLEAVLSRDERERAARFRFPDHRARFVAARGVLRNILAIHLSHAPDRLKFAYSEHGKPFVIEPADTRIEFNLSHSSGVAIYAVSRGLKVGVDIEFIKPEGSWLRIAEQYFSPEEAAELRSLQEGEMRNRFFELWSEKEAVLKAIGVGLRFPLSEKDTAKWTLARLAPTPGFAAALAFPTREVRPAIVRHHFVA